MKRKPFSEALLMLTLVLFSHSIKAQLIIESQLRNRFEFRDGYQKLADNGKTPTGLVSQRTRISFAYETENLKLKITPQDIRLWGGDQTWSSTGVPSNTTIGLFEGYFEVKLGKTGWLSAGRQQLKYDNERILAARNWNQNGLSYDALLFKLKFSEWNLHLGSSWNSLAETTSDNLYPTSRIKSFNYLWLNRMFNNNLSLSLLHVASGVTRSDTTNALNFRQTTGFYTEYKKDNLNIWWNVYYQYGKNQKGTNVGAFLIDADASYKAGNYTPGIGLGYLSGNSKTGADQTTDQLFDVLYGARHRYFGFMDYFRSIASHTQQGGLADYYFYLDYQFSKSVIIRNIGHYFQLAQTNPSTPIDKKLGYENDLVLKYKFSDWGAMESGYTFFLPTEWLKTIQNVPDDKFSQFFYLQLTITPTLIK